jgi:hypothetical protein
MAGYRVSFMMTTTTTFVAQEGFLTGVTIFGVGEILSF